MSDKDLISGKIKEVRKSLPEARTVLNHIIGDPMDTDNKSGNMALGIDQRRELIHDGPALYL